VWAGDLGKGSTFHQCVFLHAKKTPEVRTLRPLLHGHCGGVTDARLLLPQQQLLKAYTHAQQAVGTSQPCSHATFMPHVSLLYADIEDAAKDRLISQLQVRGLTCRRVRAGKALTLFNAPQAEGRLTEKTASFNANSIHIWRTDGDEAGWHEVADIPLVE
jgi:hypothetical protein